MPGLGIGTASARLPLGEGFLGEVGFVEVSGSTRCFLARRGRRGSFFRRPLNRRRAYPIRRRLFCFMRRRYSIGKLYLGRGRCRFDL